MSRTRIAVLGCGFISEIHISSYQRFVHDAEVVAVYSHHLDRAKKFAEKSCRRQQHLRRHQQEPLVATSTETPADAPADSAIAEASPSRKFSVVPWGVDPDDTK